MQACFLRYDRPSASGFFHHRRLHSRVSRMYTDVLLPTNVFRCRLPFSSDSDRKACGGVRRPQRSPLDRLTKNGFSGRRCHDYHQVLDGITIRRYNICGSSKPHQIHPKKICIELVLFAASLLTFIWRKTWHTNKGLFECQFWTHRPKKRTCESIWGRGARILFCRSTADSSGLDGGWEFNVPGRIYPYYNLNNPVLF